MATTANNPPHIDLGIMLRIFRKDDAIKEWTKCDLSRPLLWNAKRWSRWCNQLTKI